MEAVANVEPERRRRRRRGRDVPRALRVFDGTPLVLILAASFAGAVGFGAVRFWLSGPLIATVVFSMLLFFLRPVFFSSVRRVHVPPGFVFGLLFLAYAAARIPFSASPYEARIEWLALFSCLGAYLVLSDVAGFGRRWKVALGLLLVLITLIAWYMIIQHANGSRMVLMFERPPGYGMRASGTYHCPNHVAQVLGLGMTLGLALLLAPGVGAGLRLLGGYALVLPIYPLALTQSRAGFIGAGVGLSVTGFLIAWRKGARFIVLAMVAIPLVLGTAFWGLWTFSPENRERIEKAMRFDGAGRLVMWRNTIDLIRDRPVFGHGGNNYRYVQDVHTEFSTMRARYAHNEFLHVTADYGVVGFGLWALFFGVGGIRLLRRIRTIRQEQDAALAAGLLGVLAGMLAHNFFDFTFHLYANALMLAVVAGVITSVLFKGGAFSPRFPAPRAWRPVSVGLALLCAGVLGWTVLSWASAVQLFPARRAHGRMEDRRAEQLYRRAIRLDPGNWAPYLELARMLRQQAHWNPDPETKNSLAREAEALFRRCLEVNPWQYEARYGLSRLFVMEGDNERALEELRVIVQKAPRYAYYHSAVGVQLRRMGRNEEALEAFRTALSLDPRDDLARANIQSLRRRGIR